MLPLKTTMDDIDILTTYLKSQVGWTTVERLRTAIDSKHADNRKLEAARYIGLVERDGENIRLSSRGREYAGAAEGSDREVVLLKAIQDTPLYSETVQWLHWTKRYEPNKPDIGNYWHDKHPDKLEGAKNTALTDAAVFFLRLAGAAGLGQFIPAGNRRPETLLRADPAKLAAYVEAISQGSVDDEGSGSVPDKETPAAVGTTGQRGQTPPPPPPPPAVNVQTSPAVHVNIEIHIAADATAATVEEIFKNMRKYVLNNAATEDGE
ncbi:hypothetical protein [Mycobacteroides abscessus]|uniref:hypothetical protein n=1 Tax=Mycobacteroides abscessus TaxID=36809 RepID=UPI000C25A45B|nr:hypothetical protein [Mycobacteroides abscessus]